MAGTQGRTRFWANVLITALLRPDGQLAGFAKVTRDITELRLAGEASREAAKDLESANRRLTQSAEETAQFLAITAHELSSSVTAMTGAADILHDFWDEMAPEERDETLHNIVRGGVRMRRLLDDLLMAARLEAGSFEFLHEPVPVAHAVEEAIGERPQFRETITVDIPAALSAFADRTRTVQIIANLLSNAWRYGRPPIRVGAQAQGRLITVRVQDAGDPLPAQSASQLFDRFVQGSDPTAKGPGLGLFIVRELARGQGGDAWYEADGSGGNRFCFSLPLHTGSAVRSDAGNPRSLRPTPQ